MLKYPVFSSSGRIQKAANNAPPLTKGNRGYAVTLLQAALIDLGYKMPISTRNKGVPDGIYGSETKSVVWKFQDDKKLGKDGVAGKNTIGRIDQLMVAKTQSTPKPPLKIMPPKPAVPTSRDYKIGTDDPKITPDKGSGIWNSKSLTVAAVAQKAMIEKILPIASVYIGSDAVKHLKHYFSNFGIDLKIDLVGMVNEVPSAKKFYELEVNQAKKFVEQLPLGTHNITSKRLQGGYNEKRESKNWYFAVGGYSVWGKGRATVTNGPSGRKYTLEFEYKFFDRYNWDKGKKVKINVPDAIPFVDDEVTITDEFMGEFHRQGLAREYDEIGSFRKTIHWNHGDSISTAQMKPGSR